MRAPTRKRTHAWRHARRPLRYFQTRSVFTFRRSRDAAETFERMNVHGYASRAHATSALWRIGVCALLALAFGSLIVVKVSAHEARRGLRAAPSSLDVQPFPGTPDASPQTAISFPALAPSDVRSIRVIGSHTGPHAGRISALPDGHGTAFTPSRPFVSGERVSVTARLSSPAAGRASGAPGSTRISYSFGVMPALSAVSGRGATGSAASAGPDAAYVTRHDIRESSTGTHTFHSEGWLHPPMVWTSGSEPDANTAGDILTDAHRVYVQAGPLIFNPKGQLIWFYPVPHKGAGFNTEVQRYQGQQVLTFWEGQTSNGYGGGEDVVLNHHYQTVATVKAGNGYQADLHEFYITPQGNAFITIYAPVQGVDLSSLGGPRNGTLLDSIIQEVNIKTGQVLWEWHAYGHVHLGETYEGRAGTSPYDWFHINSIQPLPNGNLLVSARNTWTVYEINMQTGKIPYNFGGKHSSFKTGSGANFEWQHDAVIQPDGTMTVFDDADGFHPAESQSRALRLSINYTAHTTSLVRSYTNTPPLLSANEGSMQVFSDGSTLVAWGSQPYISEFSTAGQQVFSMHYGSPMENYRAFQSGWWGQPEGPSSNAFARAVPNIATAATGQGTTMYAAWDGATTVASWRVLAGSSPRRLAVVGTYPYTGFETNIYAPTKAPYLAVQALGPGGGVRATSRTVARGKSG